MISDKTWQSLFAAESVAVVGASNAPGSWGDRITRNLLAPQNRPIYAVNPNSPEVHGLTTYESLTKIPDPVDLAVIVVRAPLVAGVLRECVQKNVKAAVVIAGGFRETAKPEGVIVITKGQDNRPIPIRADLKQAVYGQGENADVVLRPYDIVYVPKTWIAEANKFVNQYVERLLLFKGTSVGFGFTYELNDNDLDVGSRDSRESLMLQLSSAKPAKTDR